MFEGKFLAIMIIAGIDPGTQRTGYAIMRVRSSGSSEILDLGAWNLLEGSSSAHRPSVGARLELLARELRALLVRWNPEVIGLEKAVTFRSVSAAHTLSEARGVVRLVVHETLASAEQRLVELSPTSVKKEASGFGLSSKPGVQRGLQLRFPGLVQFQNAKGGNLAPDAFDALAIAWAAWTLKGRYQRKTEESVLR